MNALPRLFVGLVLCAAFFFAGDFILTRFFPSPNGERGTLLSHVGSLLKEARLSDEIQGRQQASLHRINLKQEVVNDLVARRITVREAYACFVEINAEGGERFYTPQVDDPAAQVLLQWTMNTMKIRGQYDPEKMTRIKKELEEAQRGYRENGGEDAGH